MTRPLLYDPHGGTLVEVDTQGDRARALLCEVFGLLLVISSEQDIPLETMDPQSAMRAIASVVGQEALMKRWPMLAPVAR